MITKIPSLPKGSHIHLMGICGTAMASLAGLLKDRGFRVTGSDANPYPPMSTQLEQLEIPVMNGYRAENLNPKPDFVIVGNVISKTNPEAQELIQLGIPYTSLPQAMGEWIIADKASLVVSGTHGKTTTTSLVSWILDVAGRKPGFLIGGIPKNFQKSFRNPQGNEFVIEGDEYDTAYFDKVPKFVHYRPTHAILTSIEFDHADIYKDLEDVKSAFRKLLHLIPSHGSLFYCAHEKNIAAILESEKASLKFPFGARVSYGISQGEVQCRNQKDSPVGMTFEVWRKNEKIGDFRTPMSGQYNLLNATAAIGLTASLGVPVSSIQKALETFEGVKRRQEILGEPRGVLVIEDFAHHPTAVKETISGIKSRYPNRKMFAVFEPRSATSRRKVFQKDYVLAFQAAERILLAKAFDQSKINESDRFSSEELVADLQSTGRRVTAHDSADQIVDEIRKEAQSGDLVLIMSNGGFDGIYGKLLKALG